MLLLLVLLVVLIVWAVTSGGGGGDTETTGDGHNGDRPAESITPGPTPSESFIDTRPGGREESESGEGTGESDGESGDGGAAETGGGSGGDAAGSGDAGGSATGGGRDDSQGGGQGGDPSGVPACRPRDVTLDLSSKNEYGLDEKPELRLTVTNVSGVPCAVDFGYAALTLTITDADAEQVWSSADCPEGPASDPVVVWADETVSHTVTWDRRHSTDDCDGSPGRKAKTGASYLVEATLSGFSTVPQTSFRLDND